MKKIIIAITVLIFSQQAFSQWVSPSNNQSFTLSSLSILAPDVVEKNNNSFFIKQNITISKSDTLLLLNLDSCIKVNPAITIEINGTLITENRNTNLIIKGLPSTSENPFEFKFDSAENCIIKNTDISNCNRILLINSDITFSECIFHNFSNHVISYMNCNPTIEYCHFYDNYACAIQSAINTEGSPKILYNILFNNVLANTNNPQINIGPSSSDSILIIGNTIEGVSSTMSGGIGISNLYNSNITKVLIKDNIIKSNRYGFTQNGYRIMSYIYNNQIVYNNLEVNPNNGGSGISIFGYDTTCASIIRNNLITGNLWGITSIYYNSIDLGSADDQGFNIIYDNGNNGIEYALFNNSNSNINAVGNYWGYDNIDDVEEIIYHHADSSIYGTVNYQPIYVIEPEISSFAFFVEDNPTIVSDAFGIFSENRDTIFVTIQFTENSSYSNLKPRITTPYGIFVEPSPDDFINFDNPITYTASTPHQTSKNYTIIVNQITGINNFKKENIIIYPNPVVSNYLIIKNTHNDNLKIRITSIEGKVIDEAFLKYGENKISIKNLSSGTYIVKIFDKADILSKKIIVKQ